MTLKPDLVWHRSGKCVFVGDAKYKNITGERVPNADLYQLLAYTTAADLLGGMLIYAKGEAEAAIYDVRHSGKRLEVESLDLEVPFDDVLAQIEDVAGKIKQTALR